MCVLCAYVGKKTAAPELWRMGTAIEGLWSGFYTGLVTLDDAGFHSKKCTGWSKYWQERYRLEDLPGTIGMFHSRTKSGGGDAWAHPFIGSHGIVALVGQGNSGVFPDMTPFSEEGTRLLREGREFPSSDFELKAEWYPLLGNGARVHVSEVVTNAVEARYEACGDPLQAIRDATVALREEGVSLFLFRDRPGIVYFSNVNQRLAVCFTQDGVYAATSALAFGQPLIKNMEIPINCVGYFTADKLYTENLPPCQFPFVDRIPNGCLRAAIDFLKKHGSATLSELYDNEICGEFSSDRIWLRALTAHRLGELLVAEGFAEMRSHEVEGVNGRMGLETRFYPCEK